MIEPRSATNPYRLLTLSSFIIPLLAFGVIAIIGMEVERCSPDANIRIAQDAIWCIYVTITTVGFGNFFPVASFGHVARNLIMARLVNAFLSPAPQKQPTAAAPTLKTIRAPHLSHCANRRLTNAKPDFGLRLRPASSSRCSPAAQACFELLRR